MKRGYASYSNGLPTVCDISKQKDQLWSFMASSEILEDFYKWQTLT